MIHSALVYSIHARQDPYLFFPQLLENMEDHIQLICDMPEYEDDNNCETFDLALDNLCRAQIEMNFADCVDRKLWFIYDVDLCGSAFRKLSISAVI